MSRPWVRAALLGVAVLLAACSLPSVGLWSGAGHADTGLYGLYGHRIAQGELPYRDFYMEFPPGAIPALVLPDAISHAHYPAAFHAVQLGCLAGCVALLAWALAGAGVGGRRLLGACALAGAAPAALGQITLNAFDAWPALLSMAAVALVVRRRETAGLAFLGLATVAKIFPAALLPLLLAHAWRRAGGGAAGRRAALRGLLAYAAAVAVVALPFFALAPGGLGYSLKTQVERHLQMESLGASILMALDHLGATTVRVVVGTPFSFDVPGGAADAIAALTTLLSVVAVLVPLAAWLRARDPGEEPVERLLLAVAATVTGLVAFGRVLSPQYLVWLVPLTALTAPRRAWPAWGLLALSLGLTQVWFPHHFFEIRSVGGITWVVLVRNVALVGVYVALLAPLVRDAGGPGGLLPRARRRSSAATTA